MTGPALARMSFVSAVGGGMGNSRSLRGIPGIGPPLQVFRRVFTRMSATFRSRHLQLLPRSPHRDTCEFAKGWRDAINGVPETRCPYSASLNRARWADGYDAALEVRARRQRARSKPNLEALLSARSR